MKVSRQIRGTQQIWSNFAISVYYTLFRSDATRISEMRELDFALISTVAALSSSAARMSARVPTFGSRSIEM